ncbi:MAG: HD domain-containing protein [Deltaproteobacteria bacterium]|nr:HD domain-containing protein [Deltaproteobacteria bacterium]
MDAIYVQIRQLAQQIASHFPIPDFYQDYELENDLSYQFFEENPVISRLKSFIADCIDNDFGHGMNHAEKVTLDAGALMYIEGKAAGYTGDLIDRKVMILQCAGLLHDIKRKEKDHAIKGADFARKILKDYPLTPEEVDDICVAIRNHEAFKSTVKMNTAEGVLMSNCLYDADKFRWGPDNFTHTVWDMLSSRNPPLTAFIDHFPSGMEGISKIKSTFRSKTGQKYGPQFIDLGIAIGTELLEVIKTELAQEL